MHNAMVFFNVLAAFFIVVLRFNWSYRMALVVKVLLFANTMVGSYLLFRLV